MAALSEVLIKEGMDDWDDETYAGYAQQMKQASIEITSAVKLSNYDQARKASGDAKKACTECHELYR